MKKLLLSASGILLFQFTINAQAGFTKVVNAANPVTTFNTPGIYKGASWIDLDGDNDLDLFATPNKLFRNDGGGNFSALPNLSFTPAQNPGGSSWADLDNDGDIDCIIAQNPSGVFLNDGIGNFTDVSSSISNLNAFPSWGCAIGDWNKDAYVDFIFAHAANFHTPGPFPCKLYLNSNSSVNPLNITGYAITDSTKPYTVPYWSDFDMDGDMDLFIASGPGGSPGYDFCYRNLKVETGLDTMERMTAELFTTQMQDGQCYNFIDADNDGDLDLCLTNYAGAQTRFYENNAGIYSLHTMPWTATASNLTNCWGDYDNDGDQDVLISSDNVPVKYYRNNGGLSFATAVILGVTGACGISNGDYDNDGDLDFFANGLGAARALFRNDSVVTGNNWINFKCNGTTSNKSAIGTRVLLKATINGNSFWQIREISAQNSFQSQNDLRVHFGLGDATTIDSIQFIFPSGQTDVIVNVAANQFYCHNEGTTTLCLLSGLNESKKNNGLNLSPNPAAKQIRISSDKLNQSFDGWIIYDESGKIMLSSSVHSTGEIHIDVSNLAPSYYWISIKSDGLSYPLSFIKH